MQENDNKIYENEIIMPVMKRAVSFLDDEMGIKVVSKNLEVVSPKKIELKKNTAMIGTGGSIQVLATMGYDDSLLDELVSVFLEGEEPDEDELDEIRESVSCEVINTIVGNALVNPVDDTALSITPPILIYEAKSLFKHKNSRISTVTIKTEFGDMLLTIVGPKQLFANELNFKEL